MRTIEDAENRSRPLVQQILENFRISSKYGFCSFLMTEASMNHFCPLLEKLKKKVPPLVVRLLRPYPPPPLELSGQIFWGIILELQKKFFIKAIYN